MPTATSTCITKSRVSAFSFEGADVRVLTQSDEPWWVLADVCKVLEIRNSSDAANRLDEDERSTIAITDSGNLNAERTIINESGLYSLILTSRKPAAKRFKKWVTAEVSFTSVGKGFFEKQSDCLSFIFDSLLKPKIFYASP